MKKYFILLLFTFFVFLFLPTKTFAARSLTFTVDKTLLKEDELTVTATTSGFTNGEKIFVKGAFYKEGSSSNYFGYTQKDGSWVKNSASTTDQRLVTVGSWDGIMKVKSDYGDSGFTGNGSYQFKVGFYVTDNGANPDPVAWSGTITTISLEAPPPTNTPTTTPTKTPTPNPTSTNTPTQTSAPTATKTPAVTKTVTPSPTSKTTPTETPEPTEEDVLGAETTPTATIAPSPIASTSGTTKGQNMVIAFAFVGAGTGILAIMSLISIIRRRNKAREYLVEE